MSGIATMLAATAAALITMVLAAARLPGIAKVFLFTQVVYWSFSYLARPLVLLWVQPTPGFADPLADPRLADIGYHHGIAMVLQPVVIGLWVYAALVVGYALWVGDRANARRPDPADDPHLVPTLATVFVLGMLGRSRRSPRATPVPRVRSRARTPSSALSRRSPPSVPSG